MIRNQEKILVILQGGQQWCKFCICPKRSPSHVLANISFCPHLENVYQEQIVFSHPTTFSYCWCSGNTKFVFEHHKAHTGVHAPGLVLLVSGFVWSTWVSHSWNFYHPHWFTETKISTQVRKITCRARDPQPQRQIFKQRCTSLYFPSYCPFRSLKKDTQPVPPSDDTNALGWRGLGPGRSSNPLERCSTTEQFHLLSWPFCTLLYFDTGEAAGFGKPAKHKPFGGLSNVSMPLIRNQTRFYWILPIHQRKPTD